MKNTRLNNNLCLLLLFSTFCLTGTAQQVADSAFTFLIHEPAYQAGKGPVITIDEAHFNFHTLDGRYYPFAKLLREDGYMLMPGTERFTKQSLSKTGILVIANALADNGPWVLPTNAAFTDEEIAVVETYVEEGGSLLLIADHMPFPGAAHKLAATFGFEFINGFAIPNNERLEIFSRTIGNLHSSPVTDGSLTTNHIDSIVVFTGQGFIAPPDAQSFLLLDTAYTILLPDRAWAFDDNTPRRSGEGLVGGACMEYGKGRIVVMGEAAMFTAQLAGMQRRQVGMNHRSATQNPQLLLNIMHWLDQ